MVIFGSFRASCPNLELCGIVKNLFSCCGDYRDPTPLSFGGHFPIRSLFFFLITAIFLLRTVFYMNWLHDSHDSLIITIFSIHFGQCISIFSSFCSPLDVMQLGCRGDRSHHFQKKLGQFFSKKGANKCTTT